MPILNNIPRKNAPKIVGNVFTMRTYGHDTILGFDGLSYNSPFTESPIPPMSGQFNAATQPYIPAMQASEPGVIVPTHQVVRTGPQLRTVLHTTGAHVRPATHRAGGPSKTSDTPFHPGPRQPSPKTNRVKGVTTEKGSTGNSVATGTPKSTTSLAGHVVRPVSSFGAGSQTAFGTLGGHPHSDLVVTRWKTIKHGAAG
jgi:hypothetical protein